MTIFDFLFMALPVVFLIASVLIAVKAVSAGKSRKRTLLMQLASFAAVFAICMVCPFAVSAATGDAAVSDGAAGMNYIAAAAATGLSCIGGGIAVGNAAPAAIGATSEDPKASVRQSSLLHSVKALRFTVCLFLSLFSTRLAK